MTVQTISLAEKISRAQVALKAGLLNNHVSAKYLQGADSTEQAGTTSWGSAMRV